MSWWQARGHARVSPTNPRAIGICDCCGFWYQLNELNYQFQYAGPKLINLHQRVCKPCYDKPSFRNYPFALPPDPVAVRDPRPWPTGYDFGFTNAGGVLMLNASWNYPMSPAGLPPGSVWNSNFSIHVTPGVLPSLTNPAPAVFYGGEISATQLLRIGGGNLPLTDPLVNTQLWNNSGVVNVSSG